MVKKKDGSYRFCVDFRKIHKVTKVDSFTMPLVADALDSLAGAGVFSTLDLKNGFWQIQMQQNSQQKTAFATHNGLYEFLTMPFGLVNSGASIQRLMGHILRGLEYRFALIYIDDIIIFSLNKLVEYLGHVVTPEGISPSPDKIRVVQEFPTPTNLKELRSFLGLRLIITEFLVFS